MKKYNFKKVFVLICLVQLVFSSCSDDDSATLPQEGPSTKVFDGNVVLSSQAQVDDFTAENYNQIVGNLTIGFDASSSQLSDITSLSAFTALTGIGGEINISNNPLLPNLEGLNSLNFVRGLEFRNNSSITSLAPLTNVLELTYLQVEDNDALVNLEGLNAVTLIEQYLIVARNQAMTNLNGLNSLEAVEDGNLVILNNELLDTISALSNLEVVAGDLTINRSLLTSFTGLENLATVDGDLFFTNNFQLNNYCALNNLIIQNAYPGNMFTMDNAYDPIVQDIIDGNCSN